MKLELDFTGNAEVLQQIASDLIAEFGYDSDGMDLGEAMGVFIQHAFSQIAYGESPEFALNAHGEFLHCSIEYDLFNWEGIDNE